MGIFLRSNIAFIPVLAHTKPNTLANCLTAPGANCPLSWKRECDKITYRQESLEY